MAADAGLKQEIEALSVAILATAHTPADAAQPTLRQLAPLVFDGARISETKVAQLRDSVAALEGCGHVEGQVPEGIAPRAPDGDRVDE